MDYKSYKEVKKNVFFYEKKKIEDRRLSMIINNNNPYRDYPNGKVCSKCGRKFYTKVNYSLHFWCK